jgi:ATP-binding cassette, subfamily B, bacterial
MIKNNFFKNNSFIILYTKTLFFARKRKKFVLLSTILSIIAHIIQIFAPIIIAGILNTIQSQGINQENFFQIIISLSIFVIIELFVWVFRWFSRTIEKKNAFFIRANYKEYLLKNIMFLPIEWHNNIHSGEIYDKIDKSSSALFDFSGETYFFVGYLTSIITLILFVSMIYYPALIIIILLLTIIFFVATKIDHLLMKQTSFISNTENYMSEKMLDSLNNINTIIILRLEKLIRKNIMRTILFPKKTFIKNQSITELKWAIISILGVIMIFLVIVFYIINSLFNGIILIGTIYLLYEYSSRIKDFTYKIIQKYGDNNQQLASFKNIDPIINVFEKKKKIKRMNMHNWKKIIVTKMFFSYQNKNNNQDLLNEKTNNFLKNNLKNINLVINKGEKIVFVGENGSGKSTMLQIIKSLYNPKKGSVYLDDKKLKNFFKNISYKTTLITQESEIFKNTIKYNITLGIRYRKTHVEKLLKITGFDKTIKKFPEKINKKIGEKGVNLSGGEKQKLVLTRGLLAAEEKEIILLDEPTSKIDFKTEQEIYDKIFDYYNKKTIIVTTHKTNLLRMFDKIVFFDKGKIIMIGKYEELLKNKKFLEKMRIKI